MTKFQSGSNDGSMAELPAWDGLAEALADVKAVWAEVAEALATLNVSSWNVITEAFRNAGESILAATTKDIDYTKTVR